MDDAADARDELAPELAKQVMLQNAAIVLQQAIGPLTYLAETFPGDHALCGRVEGWRGAIAAIAADLARPERATALPDSDDFAVWVATGGQERAEVTIRLVDAWLLLSAVQLTTTFPTLGADLRDEMTALGRKLQTWLSTSVPECVAALAEAGWDRSMDRPTGLEAP